MWFNFVFYYCFRGNADKPNNEGATAVHVAAGAGQLHCLVFLTNFGANVHAVDDNGNSPLQEASNKGRIECMRHLESIVTHQLMQDRGKVEKIQIKAKKEAERRIREKAKLMQKLDKEYEKRNLKQLKAMGLTRQDKASVYRSEEELSDRSANSKVHNNKKLTYSQLTGLRSDGESNEYDSPHPDDASSSSSLLEDFQIVSRLSDDIVFAPAFSNSDSNGQSDSTEESQLTTTTKLTKSGSSRILLEAKEKSSFPNGVHLSGNNTVRSSASQQTTRTALTSVSKQNGRASSAVNVSLTDAPNHKGTRSAISSSSKRKMPGPGQIEVHMGPLYTFLHALNLDEFRDIFLREKIDLRACLLCDENDLREIGLPLGPRKKIVDAIIRRNESIRCSDDMEDSMV